MVGRQRLYLFEVPIRGYEFGAGEVGAVYFPFSMLYSAGTPGFGFARFSGFFVEAGVFQAAACFCFVYESLTRRSRWTRFGHIAAVVSSLSSIGVVLIVTSQALLYVHRRRLTLKSIVLGTILISLAGGLALYAPGIGLVNKAQFASASITDRTEATRKGIQDVLDNPWGTGPNSAREHNAGITLLAAASAIGIMGFIFQFLILSGIHGIHSSGRIPKMLVCFPLLVTALLSQPIAVSGMVYVLAMVWVPERGMPEKNKLAIRSSSLDRSHRSMLAV
jgi:hypothetical protein